MLIIGMRPVCFHFLPTNLHPDTFINGHDMTRRGPLISLAGRAGWRGCLRAMVLHLHRHLGRGVVICHVRLNSELNIRPAAGPSDISLVDNAYLVARV